MSKSVANSILGRIKSKGRGWTFTPKDFVDLGSRSNVDFILHQLVSKEVIRRVGRGIYDFPAKHPKLGLLSPSIDSILKAVSAKTGEIIQPSGAEAANLLGLSEQVPARPPYLTSGNSRTIKVGSSAIRLKHTAIRPLRGKPDKVSLTLQALLYLDKKHIDDSIISTCSKQLSIEQKSDLRLMAKQVPGWLSPIIHSIVA